MAVVIAGGPTASSICAYCFSRLQSRISESSPLNGFAGIVALTSLVIGVIMSAIPARGPLRTDGALLLSLFRGGVDAKLFMVHTRVLGMHIHGVRALDWGAASVALLEPSASAQSLALTSALILYEWNLDRRESAVAGEWIDRARLTPEAQDRFGRGNVLAESAYFEAFYRHNPQGQAVVGGGRI